MTQMKEILTVQEINDGKDQQNHYDLNQEQKYHGKVRDVLASCYSELVDEDA